MIGRRKMKIVVLAGGISTERDVSLVSGSQVYKALKQNGHDVILLDVYLGYKLTDKEAGEPLADLFTDGRDWAKDISAINSLNPDVSKIKALRSDGDKNFFGPNVLGLCQEADIVFMALHGKNGEDGKIQACFELMGIRYTGANYVSSAMAMDKAITKDIFKAYGIPTPSGIKMTIDEYKVGKQVDVPYPLIVKACCGGSSIGCAIAKDESELQGALDEAFKYDSEVVVEQFIEARELTVAVMDGEALPLVEITPKVGFYDYKNKYQAGSTIEICPAPIDEDLTRNIQECAKKAYKALRLSAYARFDFLLDKKTNEYFCLEANTLPGMTPTSLVPQEAAAIGMNFNELCEKIIEISRG